MFGHGDSAEPLRLGAHHGVEEVNSVLADSNPVLVDEIVAVAA